MISSKIFCAGLLGVAIATTICGIFIGRYALPPRKTVVQPPEEIGYSAAIRERGQKILDKINADNIGENLKYLTSKPHIAGSPEDEEEFANYIKAKLEEYGFDKVDLVPYDVLLSYPEKDTPNEISIIDDKGDIKFEGHGTQPQLWSPEENSDLLYPTFNAYSGTGVAEGKPIFVNYGREEDFDHLVAKGIDIKGNIVIAKYGKIFRANIAKNAEDYGAAGLILYCDPADYSPDGRDFVFPNSTWTPGLAAPFGTTLLIQSGDPLTPNYPSIESAYRIKEEDSLVPRVLIQPLGYDDVEVIFSQMDNANPSPTEWVGKLNAPYYLGPGFADKDLKLKMDIKTKNKRVITYNIVATMYGEIEPDRFVVVGNHRDAWMMGAIDPSSATAAMLELARVLGEFKQSGWRPRRSLVFAAWGAEEYGLVGSMEWIQEFMESLRDRVVAYLNMDLAVQANETCRALGVPTLYNLLYDVSKAIPNPNQEEVALGRKTLFDNWLHFTPAQHDQSVPWVRDIGSGSDFRGFIHDVGIPSTDIRYIANDTSTYPLYHTLYETYHLVSSLIDNGFHFHKAITQYWGMLALNLTDQVFVPLDSQEYGNYLERSINNLEASYSDMFSSQQIKFDYLKASVVLFKEAARKLHQELIPSIDTNDRLRVRDINDRLMMVERGFVNPRGLPMRNGYNMYNHVVFAASSYDAYSGITFSGLVDLFHKFESLTKDEQAERWELVKEHLAEITFRIQSAATVLSGDLHRVSLPK